MKASVKEVNLDGKEYRIEPYVTTRGILLLKDLTALIGEPIIRLIAALPKGKSVQELVDGKANILEADVDLEMAANILSASLMKLSDENAEKLLRNILSNTFYKNTSCSEIFDSHFQGDYKHLFKVIAKTLGVQYGDFLAAVTGGVLKRPVKTTAQK